MNIKNRETMSTMQEEVIHTVLTKAYTVLTKAHSQC